MLDIPVLRWGKPYESLDKLEVRHFETGEPVATISQANGGMVVRDMRQADRARQRLREFTIDQLLECATRAADLFENETLPVGNGVQSPEDFVTAQSATTGLPQSMCRANIQKNSFVLRNMRQILDCLTRGLPLDILTRGYGTESRGVVVSYQAQSPVLGAVLPSNSPGVHTLWLPAIPLQLGLVLKPGSSEPWTVYRMVSAFAEAGIPAEVMAVYPGGHDVGSSLLTRAQRAMMFGSQQTVQQYAGNPRVQVHGPGFSKILIGDDCVDDWPEYLDVMVDSVLANGGRSCINASGIWASRHTEEIAKALAERLGPVEPLPSDHPDAALAAFTTPGAGAAIWNMLESDLKAAGVKHMTEDYGDRVVDHEKYAYLRPVVAHCDSPDCEIASREFMFPFVSVVRCDQDQMLKKIGPTLVCSAITRDPAWQDAMVQSTEIDRLNLGAIPTHKVNWLQPHEGNLIDFLFRSRAVQLSPEFVPSEALS